MNIPSGFKTTHIHAMDNGHLSCLRCKTAAQGRPERPAEWAFLVALFVAEHKDCTK